MFDPVEHDLHNHLLQIDAEQAEAEWIENRQSELLAEFAEYSYQQLEDRLQDYYIELDEWIQDHIGDDGVKEYFIEGKNAHYRNAVNTIIDDIDLNPELESYKNEP